MCKQCVEISIKIERYRRLIELIDDEQTREAINRLRAELEAKKLALHSSGVSSS